jgi:CIC family chloride channel protein
MFVVLGVLSAIFGTYFQRSTLFAIDVYRTKMNFMPAWAWGAIAGLITGIAGLWIPQALGGGHTTLEGVLAGAYVWSFIPLLFVAKYLLTVIAYGSGVPGGIFAPALILGALLGSMLGNFVNFIDPTLNIDPASFAFVGMGAFFTAISRAPITSIVMLFELTGNYQLVLPLMFGCIIANISAERLMHGSVYENLLEKDGINIKEYSSPSYLQRFNIEEAMTTKLDTIPETMTLKDLHHLFENSDHTGFPILDINGKLTGIVTQKDMHDAYDEHLDLNIAVSEIMSTDLKVLSLNDNLHSAILKLYEFKIGRLLIVDEQDHSRLVGIITRSDIINFEANQELGY